jgi:YbbR domain-containing protein
MKWNREAVRRALSPRKVFGVLRDAVVRDVGLKLLSLLVAFALWFFVNVGERDTEAAFQVPLELRNIPSHLMLVSPRTDFIDLRVIGPRTLLSRIDQERLSMSLDLGGVRPGPAVFRLRPEVLELPRGVNVVRLTPSEVTLELARVVRKTVPVRLTFSGKPPIDLRVTEVKLAPEAVEVFGPSGEVDDIKAAETEPLDLSGAESGIIERDVGLAVPQEYLSFSASLVHARVRLEEPEQTRVLKSIPVIVRNSEYRTEIKPEKVRITLRGPLSVIEALELGHGAVYIDATDLAPGSYEMEPQVDLPFEVELVKQEPGTVKLTVLVEKRRQDGEQQ